MDENQSLLPNFRDERVQGAVRNLLIYSLTIIAVPLGSMFAVKAFIFEALLGYSSQDSILYAAIFAVILVHVVLGLWVVTAYQSDQKAVIKKKE